MDGKKPFGSSGQTRAAGGRLSAEDREMLRNEFEVMQRCDFALLKDLGTATAEEYILRITTLEFTGGKED